MTFEYFVAKKIRHLGQRSFTRVIMRLAFISIIISVAVMIASDAIGVGFQTQIKNKITGFSSHIQVSKTKTNFAYENDPVKINLDFEKKVLALPGVKHLQYYATKPGIIKSGGEIEGVVMKGVDRNYDWTNFKPYMVEGSVLHLKDSEPSEEIIMSGILANKLNLKLHDTIVTFFFPKTHTTPLARNFIISGIYETDVEEIDNDFMIADIRQIQGLNKWGKDEIGGYEIYMDNLDILNATNQKIRDMIPVDQETLTIHEQYPQIFDWLDLMNMNITIILTLMTLVASINMITALLIMILERTQMIGILKALGITNGGVRRIFIFNAMRIIGYGILLGNAFAFVVLLAQKYLHIIKLPKESYYLSEVPVYFNWGHIIAINVGAFIICSLSMLLPSILATRILPVKALRFD